MVLAGGGHAHVTALKILARRPLPAAGVTLISRELCAPYSGMLPGYVAGRYSFADIRIDLASLAAAAGARLVHDEIVSLDVRNKRLACRGRTVVDYDVLSLNIGAASAAFAVPGAAVHALPVKPIAVFTERWRRLHERLSGRRGQVRIGVVGAGAGGVELALAVQHRLENAPPGKRPDGAVELHLFTAAPDVLVTHNRWTRARLRRALARRGVRLHLAHEVAEVHAGGLRCANGAAFDLDAILWATAAAAPDWPSRSGLAVDEQGFVTVAETLESVSHPGVFAAGDIACVAARPLPKSGVFAVRQGAPLVRNIRNRLLGRPLAPHRPRRHSLSLVSTGDRRAVASWSGAVLEGRWAWRWKDWIDRRFVRQCNRCG